MTRIVADFFKIIPIFRIYPCHLRHPCSPLFYIELTLITKNQQHSRDMCWKGADSILNPV